MHQPFTQPLSRRALVASSLAALGAGLAGCSAQNLSDNAQGSGDETSEPRYSTRVGAMLGPTGMGLVGLMDALGYFSKPADASEDSVIGTNPAGIASHTYGYEIQLAASADELAPKLLQGELDCLCVPANLAATLYQRTEGEVRVININTLGVLDIVACDTDIASLTDLAGRTVFSAGRGSTPQYALEYLLHAAGLEPGVDVVIEWKSEHAECLAALEADRSAICMLPQPFATSALTKVEGARIVLDLTEVWNETVAASDDPSQLITGVTVARKAFVDESPEAVDEFLALYRASVDFVNRDPAGAAELIETAGIVDAAVAERAIPYCHIVCITDDEMRSALEGYLDTLYQADPESVGGALPKEDFYYRA